MGKDEILILIPAYRDVELSNTIKSALKNAGKPEKLRFGVLNQFGPETSEMMSLFRGDKRFRIIEMSWQDVQGEGWARGLLENLYRDEEYVLQTDAHMLFVKDWDEELKDSLGRCNGEKIVLSSYPIKFEYDDDNKTVIETEDKVRLELRPGKGRYNFESSVVDASESDNKMKKSLYATGGMEFFKGELLKEVHYFKEIAFTGSEIVRSAQLYTFGYDIYAPVGLPIYHHYGRQSEHKFWDDMQEIPELKDFYDALMTRSDKIVDDIINGKIDGFERYFGNKRSISDFLKQYRDELTSRDD